MGLNKTPDEQIIIIGSFEVNVGICGRAADGSLPTFTAETEVEWQNVVARLQSQLHQYLLLSE